MIKMLEVEMKDKATRNLYPSVATIHIENWTCVDTDNNEIEIDESLVTKETTRLQAEYDATQYQRDRQYPSIGDQLDMQYHDQIDGTTTWKDAIAKVKADNPKPE